MKIRYTIAIIVAITTAILGIDLTANMPANASTSSIGPGWSTASVDSTVGADCIEPSSDERLAPIISWPCNDSTWVWEWRWMNPARTEIELANTEGTLAVGFSGGEFKLETPNDNTSYLKLGYYPDNGTNMIINQAGTDYMFHTNKGTDVAVYSYTGQFVYDWTWWIPCGDCAEWQL